MQINQRLKSVLNIQYDLGVNEFRISQEEEKPCIVLLTNDYNASLTFFPKGEHPGFQSVGVNNGLTKGDTSIFYTNTPTEEIEVANEFIIEVTKAEKAVEEFFVNLSMPSCIEWVELKK